MEKGWDWTWRTKCKICVLVVQSLSRVWLSVTLWTAACQASLSFTSLRVCSNSCPLSQWCHLTTSSSVVPFSSCPQSFLATGSYPVSQLFASGNQSIEASASSSVLPMKIQDWFSLGLTGLISLQSKGLSRVFSSTRILRLQFFGTQPSLWSNSHIHVTTRTTTALTRQNFVGKMMPLLFNIPFRLVIAFLPRSKRL